MVNNLCMIWWWTSWTQPNWEHVHDMMTTCTWSDGQQPGHDLLGNMSMICWRTSPWSAGGQVHDLLEGKSMICWRTPSPWSAGEQVHDLLENTKSMICWRTTENDLLRNKRKAISPCWVWRCRPYSEQAWRWLALLSGDVYFRTAGGVLPLRCWPSVPEPSLPPQTQAFHPPQSALTTPQTSAWSSSSVGNRKNKHLSGNQQLCKMRERDKIILYYTGIKI